MIRVLFMLFATLLATKKNRRVLDDEDADDEELEDDEDSADQSDDAEGDEEEESGDDESSASTSGHEDSSSSSGPKYEDIKDPRTKVLALQDQINRREKRDRMRAKRIADLEEEVATLKAAQAPEALHALKVENAILRDALGRSGSRLDWETAMVLGRERGMFDLIKVDEHGTLSGVDDAIDAVLDRYPWLDDLAPNGDESASSPRTRARSAPPIGSGKKKAGGIDRTKLEQRFPALKRGSKG